MEMFVTNDEVVHLENSLSLLPENDPARVALLVTLSWFLRQRDTRRALQYADDAAALLAQVPDHAPMPASRQLLQARLLLVRAEAAWLFFEIDSAQQLADAALHMLASMDTREGQQGCADGHYVLIWVAFHRGELAQVEAEVALASSHASRARDLVRELMAQAFLATQIALRNPALAQQRWGTILSPEAIRHYPALASSVNEFIMVSASLSSDFGRSAVYGTRSYEEALEFGQIRHAIAVASNVGDAFNSLNDQQTALHWMQVSHDLAKQTGWPVSIGSSLTQMAETFRRMGQLDTAKDMLQDAIPILAPVMGSRSYLLALRYLGDLLLDRGECEAAITCFDELQKWADDNNQLDFKISARRGLAHALSLLGQPQRALELAETALLLARQGKDVYRQIDVLRVLASIHQRASLPLPADMLVASALLHYLQQALATAAGIDGYHVTAELLEQVADAQAALGGYQEAFRLSRLAAMARDKTHNQEMVNRSTALQVSHQTERMRAEAEHLRQLALAEAERAEVLQKNSLVLERLGMIGQEITASLDADAVFQTLNRHVQGLLHVTAFVVYLMEPDQQSMISVFGMENGQALETYTVLMSDHQAYSVCCIRERREILIELAPGEVVDTLISGTEPVLSMLFAPLIIAGNVLGVMTIQSSLAYVYGERERMIFRSLCAYGAIAMSNADAYLRLKETQAHLVAQEKLAALGALVAGVAHELNTPIGNCLLVASTLQDVSKNLMEKLDQQSLRRSELNTYFDEVKTSASIMMRGLSSAATLITSFKQVAVDRTSEQRRVFDLQQVLQDIIATLHIRIGHAGHALQLAVPAKIQMDSYPGSLGQVITNLIENAILHAFVGIDAGSMTISASQSDPQRVLICFSDNGCGIPEANLTRVFDPFFTTRLGQGGSGLGLNISYNIVHSILQGQLTVKSTPGEGTRFYLDLPLVV
ncbi:hypothetical protein BH11PSE12_BH11PSE12_06310 [soil metagenome]